MDTFPNNDPFRHRLPEVMRQYRRPPTLEPPAPEIEEPELTDSQGNPFARLLTADEIEELTSIKKTWWLAEARADRIPHIRAGKYVRFEYSTVVQFLRERSANLREHR